MTAPPTPKEPAWVQKVRWVTNPVSYMEDAQRQCGDIFTGNKIGSHKTSLIYISHPTGIQKILSKDNKELSAPGSVNGIVRPLVGDYSVILLDGDRHKRERQLLVPPFHGERLRAYGDLMCNLTKQVMDRLPANASFVARPVMQEITLLVILQAVFGVAEGERYERLKDLTSKFVNFFSSSVTSSFLYFPALQKNLGPLSPWSRFLKLRQEIDKVIYAEIRDRRQQDNSERTDILSLIMMATDEAGEGMSDRELRDELLTLLVAGQETTASSLSWVLYWTHRDPSVLARLQEELASLGDRPDPMEITRLPYLSAVCNETLRLSPPAILTFPRIAPENSSFKLMGYDVPPGHLLMGCIYLVHQREDIYPQPKQFRPERFLERQFSAYEFLPFGGGVRRCIGAALAQMELKLVLATILSNYQLVLEEDKPVHPKRRGITLAPETDIRMKLAGIRKQQSTTLAATRV
jgi:unspecific monooxygenase